MSKYTKEQIAQADSMDLVSYLESRGYELMRQGNQYRLKEHDSLYVKGNQWYWHSQHKGGKTLDFLIDYEGMSFLDAMKALIGEEGKTERRLPIVAPQEHPDP
ncbi:MAG: topoisomerase, partial [Oscillospiraceae bacterium]|nr:topoisomerase [Oscillospiraceae bacterium]